MSQHFDWNRWLSPREKPIRFDDEGYPEDPGGRYGNVVQPDCVRLERILDARCGILLGEAGIGKSEAMDQLEARVRGRGETLIALDLGLYAEPRDLAADLFDTSTFQDWHAGGGPIWIFLDSLDEGIAGIKNIVGLLQRRLRSLPFDRLRLYISCRTTAWPETLTKHLADSFGSAETVAIFQLVPLLRADVALAAGLSGLNADAFLADVHQHDAQALACNPLTLQLLLNIFEAGGFPASNLELLERGLLALCETTRAQRDHGNAVPFSAAQLLAVASRLAAISIVTGRPTIDRAVDDGQPRIGVPLGDCLGGKEGSGADRVVVDDAAAHAALQTGLFSARGPERFGFAHKTYGEYLTARYLARTKLPARQMDSVLCLTDRTPPEFVPQLHEVVAWLASLDRSLIDRLIDTEPDILLTADLAAENTATRERVVAGILGRTEAGAFSYDRRRELAPRLNRLSHAGLSAQLIATISNRSLSDATREMALTIAEQCRATGVAAAAADVTLDDRESFRLRIDAGYAVCRLDIDQESARLRPLAHLDAQHDPLDELRGLALRACWPRHITAAEFFDVLQPPRRSNFGGSYSHFLFSTPVVDQLDRADLAVAVAWTAHQPLDRSYSDSITRIAGAIVTRTFRDNRHDLVSALVPILYRAYHDFRCPFFVAPQTDSLAISNDTVGVNTMLSDCVEMRRHVIASIVTDMAIDTPFYLLAHSECPLVREEDFVWLLNKACRVIGDRAVAWAQLAKRVMNWSRRDHLDEWLRREDCPAVAAVLAMPRFVALDSDEARQMREEYNQLHRYNRGPQPPRLTPQERTARIDASLAATFDHPDNFVNVVAELARDLQTGRIPLVPSDIRATGGWQATDPEFRLRILDAAERYFTDAAGPSSQPIQRLRTWSIEDQTPASALLLLLYERPATLNAFPERAWRQHAAHVLGRLIGFFQLEDAQRDAITTALQAHSPDVCRALVLAIIDDDSLVDHVSSVVRVWGPRLDAALADALFERVRDREFNEPVYRALVGWLLSHEHVATAQYLIDIVEGPPSPRRLVAAVVAVRNRPAQFWSMIWPLIDTDRHFGRSLIEQVLTFADEGGKLLPGLSSTEAGRLLDWLLTEYPPNDDVGGGGFMGPRDHARFFTNALIASLRQAGTNEACNALRAVRDSHPEQAWLADVVLQAQAAQRRSAWNPPSPLVLRKLLDDRRARFVTSSTQLLDAVCESLDRLAGQLHGELPARVNLWNEPNPGIFRPRDEEHLSDTVARHLREELRERGIVANREVQIRRRVVSAAVGGQAGERTDIRVDAAALPSDGREADILTAIVEVKGSWNREVQTAMQTQLVDRYLLENRCQTGLYLVGWFQSPGWDAADGRRAQSPWGAIEEARTNLDAQAAQLTQQGVRHVRAYVLDCALP
jgi:hypothetical protein